MTHAYPVVFQPDRNGTVIARVPDVPGVMTVGKDRPEALARVHGALLAILAARMEDGERIPRPSPPARSQRVAALTSLISAKLSVYEAMRARRLSPDELARRLGWDGGRVRRLLALRRRSRLEDIEAALEALGKRLIIDVRDAA